MLQACQWLYVEIATEPDVMGELVGHALHLTVKPAEWWQKLLEALGATVRWSQVWPGRCAFLASNWLDAGDLAWLVSLAALMSPQRSSRFLAAVVLPWRGRRSSFRFR